MNLNTEITTAARRATRTLNDANGNDAMFYFDTDGNVLDVADPGMSLMHEPENVAFSARARAGVRWTNRALQDHFDGHAAGLDVREYVSDITMQRELAADIEAAER